MHILKVNFATNAGFFNRKKKKKNTHARAQINRKIMAPLWPSEQTAKELLKLLFQRITRPGAVENFELLKLCRFIEKKTAASL